MILEERVDVLVVGGGVIGLSAALAMRQRGFSVVLLDAASTSHAALSHQSKRVYALNHASQALLQSLNIWNQLDSSHLAPYRQMHIWDASNGNHLDFDARLLGKNQLGSILEEQALKNALLQQSAADGVITHFDVKVCAVSLEATHVTVREGEKQWQARFLLVADGANSPTRAALGVSVTTWSYHQQAIVATVQTEKPHHETAYQVFNPDGPLAFLPLKDPHHCSIVWSTSPTKANALMQLTDNAFNNALTTAFAEKLGHSRLIHTRQHYPLHMRHTEHYSGARWILMGDAAHTIHPLAGLGLNVGLADLHTWLNLLDEQKQNLNSSRALRAYQRQRKHAVWQTIGLMEAIKMVFSNPVPPIVSLRGVGLSLINRLPWIKRLMMAHAAG